MEILLSLQVYNSSFLNAHSFNLFHVITISFSFFLIKNCGGYEGRFHTVFKYTLQTEKLTCTFDQEVIISWAMSHF